MVDECLTRRSRGVGQSAGRIGAVAPGESEIGWRDQLAKGRWWRKVPNLQLIKLWDGWPEWQLSGWRQMAGGDTAFDEPLGFQAKAPMGVWNARIGVDYPGVFKALAKATLAVATVNAPGAVSAAIDGIFAFRAEAKHEPAELSWLLIRRALARAMARLTVEAVSGRGFVPDDKDALIGTLDDALNAAEIWIDPAFFDRPAEHPIVEAVRGPFGQWLQSLGGDDESTGSHRLNEAEARSINQRLGGYFTFALRREWAEHAEAYAPIEVALREQDTPFAKAGARERAWLNNAAYLERQIQKPVFDETFGLAQIYVPLRPIFNTAI